MPEGKLYANTNYSNYMLGAIDGPDIKEGQAVEILLGGQWIRGRVEYSHTALMRTGEGQQEVERTGAYQIPDESVPDAVTQASEFSFPASDPPAVDIKPGLARVVGGYYFRAEADGNVCGLCVGMYMRM